MGLIDMIYSWIKMVYNDFSVCPMHVIRFLYVIIVL